MPYSSSYVPCYICSDDMITDTSYFILADVPVAFIVYSIMMADLSSCRITICNKYKNDKSVYLYH